MRGKKGKTMKRILVFGMTENPGGVESFLINYYRHIDRNKIQFDFLCNTHELVAYEEELIALGGRVFHITARSKNRNLYKKQLKEVFEKHSKEWSAIWVNVCSLANIDYLKLAKKYGINKRIIHSHNSQNMDNTLRGFLHKWNKKRIDDYATDFWACSEDAAKWFYKDDVLSKAVIIHNAIDVTRLSFDEEKRKEIRAKIGVDDQFVVGNIGRLHFQKNQEFVLDIFAQFLKLYSNAKLVLVGQGEDEKKLKRKCELLGIVDSVLFAGVQSDIGAWLSAFDVFLFPSVFEGLSIVALEAQANGVPSVASLGVIPKEVRMNDNFVFYSLDNNAIKWAEKLIEIKENETRVNFDKVYEIFVSNGYEISTEIEKLESLLVM